jgi:hypothetical protein
MTYGLSSVVTTDNVITSPSVSFSSDVNRDSFITERTPLVLLSPFPEDRDLNRNTEEGNI